MSSPRAAHEGLERLAEDDLREADLQRRPEHLALGVQPGLRLHVLVAHRVLLDRGLRGATENHRKAMKSLWF